MEALPGSKPERSVKGLEIEGIWVEFPFEPYACQVRQCH